MKKLLLVLCTTAVLFACDKNSDESPLRSIYGRYTGTFHRTGMDTAQVNILFQNDNKYEGSSNSPLYPALCGGTISFDGTTLTVNDTCSWTANFDWSLIFDGSYNVSFTGPNSIRVWRTSGTITDEYLLNRFTR